MNKPLIQDLVSRFLQSYDSVAKDMIWQRQSAAFRKFWSEQVLAQGHGMIPDDTCDADLRGQQHLGHLSDKVLEDYEEKVQDAD